MKASTIRLFARIVREEDERMVRSGVLSACLALLAWRAPAQKPSFEVATVKPNMSGTEGGSAGPRGSGFFAKNMTLRNLLMYAYSPPNGQLLPAQIIGGPNWLQTDRFDIDAKPEGAGVPPIEQMKIMVQSLLEDRFHLKAHRDTRDLPVYDLVLTARGPKLSEDQTPPDPRQGFISFASPGQKLGALPRGAMRMITGPSSTTLIGAAVAVSKIMTLLQSSSDRVIVDKTGFSGLIDVHLEFSQELATAAPGTDPSPLPSLFTAIQELGLKLDSAKAPLEVIVIDSVQKPSAN